jgi:hypothetical protein
MLIDCRKLFISDFFVDVTVHDRMFLLNGIEIVSLHGVPKMLRHNAIIDQWRCITPFWWLQR